jgi:hypothetical protein
MTKVEAIKEHIKLREIFWERKYNPVHYAYGFVRCMLHSQETIEGASKGIKQYIADFGSVTNLRKEIE